MIPAPWRWPALAFPVLCPIALCLGALLWLAGFDQFERAARSPAPDPPPADGIVVLTGGSGRIEAGYRLLADGKAPRLLVSGVGGGDLPGILHRQNVLPFEGAPAPDDRITLGRIATDTIGNAAETAAWARQNDLHTLIVVTAGYHMPRALLELRRELPGIVLYPVPVHPMTLRGHQRLGSLRLLAIEYDKLLAAWFGINRLFREGPRP